MEKSIKDVNAKPVEGEADSDLRDTELIPFTYEGGIEGFLFHQQRYLNALKSIPYEFLEAVRIVCIEDRELGCDKSVPKSGIKSKYNIYYRKMLLTLGLERLVKYYLKISKNSS